METIEAIDRIHQDLKALNLATFELKEVNRLIERAFRAGMAEQPDPLEGYSNLTAAIKAGEPIDWEKLVRRKVQYVKPGFGALNWKMLRDDKFPADSASGWVTYGMSVACITTNAWHGKDGWALWIEGEVPMRRKTADQLDVGTYFLGKARGDSPCLAYVGRPLKTATVKTIYYAPDMLKAITPAFEWVVLEEYGTFQKPEGK